MSDAGRTSVLGTTGAGDLFQLLRDGRPRTRAELAALTGLARSTIGLRLDSLTELGLVGPVADAVSTGGRPPSRVALRPSSRVVLAADLGASHAHVAITDLMGQELSSHREKLEIGLGPEHVLGWMVEHADELLERLGKTRSDVIAAGIGLPGPVEFSTGRPVNPPIMPGWDAFDVPGWVRQHIDIPVFVDNDVNIMALGERQHSWPNAEHLFFLKVATGIGSGIISEASSSAALRASPATSVTSRSLAAPGSPAAAATPAASRPSPPGPRSPPGSDATAATWPAAAT